MPGKTSYPGQTTFASDGGLLNLLDVIKDIVANSLSGIITTVAVLFFFWTVVVYIWKLQDGHAEDGDRKRITWAVVLLVVLFSLYGLINISREIFGLQDNGINQSAPSNKVGF
jgi:hypothetical protein